MRHAEILIVLSLLIVSLAMRFYNLSFQSLWIDEGATYYYSSFSFVELLTSGEYSPPFFYVMQHWLLSLFGNSEWIMRVPSAIAGALSVPVMYLLVNKLLSSRNAALLAAFLLMFSQFHMYSSQDARPYAILVLFVLCEIYFYLDVLKKEDRRSWLLFVLFAWAALNFSYFAIIPTGVLFSHWLYEKRAAISEKRYRDLRPLIIYGSLFIIISSLLIYTALITIGNVLAAGTWLTGFDVVVDVFERFMYGPLFLSAVMSVFVFIGLWFCYKKDPGAFIPIILLIVASLSFLVFLSFFMRAAPRYVIFSMPLYYVAIACCLFAARSDAEQKKMLAAGLAVVTIMGSALLCSYYTTPMNSDFRGVANVLYSETAPGDCVVYVPNFIDLSYGPLSFYYDNVSDHTDITGADDPDQLDLICEQYIGSNVFIILCTRSAEGVPLYGAVFDWFDAYADTPARGSIEFLYIGPDVYLYKITPLLP
ncbi:MAG: glycosyltransferase family 39 protein [Methanomassiliicoccaceae archaeon]|nr:glycosyltransferase family 39 protein [Methanomassiliicoccaceae archaeon]